MKKQALKNEIDALNLYLVVATPSLSEQADIEEKIKDLKKRLRVVEAAQDTIGSFEQALRELTSVPSSRSSKVIRITVHGNYPGGSEADDIFYWGSDNMPIFLGSQDTYDKVLQLTPEDFVGGLTFFDDVDAVGDDVLVHAEKFFPHRKVTVEAVSHSSMMAQAIGLFNGHIAFLNDTINKA